MPSAARVALPSRFAIWLALAPLAAACGDLVKIESHAQPPNAGGGSVTTGAGGEAGGSASTSTGNPGTGSGSTGGPPQNPECTVDSHCTSFFEPLCDVETGTCGACLAGADDTCPPGFYCSKTPDGNACTSGCTSDADCNFSCDLATHQCIECWLDEHCLPSEICNLATSTCKFGCSAEHPCDPMSKKTCCGSICFDLLSDESNCGTCGNVCETDLPNAYGLCLFGKCNAQCDGIGMTDCNKLVEDGCEINTNVDHDNCGGCGNKCFSGAHMKTTCSLGQCGYTCDPGFSDCDGDWSNGCEVDVLSDANNCGVCGTICGAVQACTAGVCL